jgi:hypothetical protein
MHRNRLCLSEKAQKGPNYERAGKAKPKTPPPSTWRPRWRANSAYNHRRIK